MPDLPVPSLPPCRVDSKVLGLDVLIDRFEPGGPWASNGSPPGGIGQTITRAVCLSMCVFVDVGRSRQRYDQVWSSCTYNSQTNHPWYLLHYWYYYYCCKLSFMYYCSCCSCSFNCCCCSCCCCSCQVVLWRSVSYVNSHFPHPSNAWVSLFVFYCCSSCSTSSSCCCSCCCYCSCQVVLWRSVSYVNSHSPHPSNAWVLLFVFYCCSSCSTSSSCCCSCCCYCSCQVVLWRSVSYDNLHSPRPSNAWVLLFVFSELIIWTSTSKERLRKSCTYVVLTPVYLTLYRQCLSLRWHFVAVTHKTGK